MCRFPTFKDIELSHGEVVAVGIIRILLINLNDWLNQNRMTEQQIYEAACLMYEEGYYLKITELYEFFKRAKKGLYGNYYGSVDGLKVMVDFQQFLRERAAAIRVIREEERRRKRIEEFDRRMQIKF